MELCIPCWEATCVCQSRYEGEGGTVPGQIFHGQTVPTGWLKRQAGTGSRWRFTLFDLFAILGMAELEVGPNGPASGICSRVRKAIRVAQVAGWDTVYLPFGIAEVTYLMAVAYSIHGDEQEVRAKLGRYSRIGQDIHELKLVEGGFTVEAAEPRGARKVLADKLHDLATAIGG